MAEFRYLKNVVTLKLDTEKCIGCKFCTQVCPHGVFAMEGGKAKIVDRDGCMECGACALNCEVGAIFVECGVGCAAGVINGILRGTEPTCDCDGEAGGCC